MLKPIILELSGPIKISQLVTADGDHNYLKAVKVQVQNSYSVRGRLIYEICSKRKDYTLFDEKKMMTSDLKRALSEIFVAFTAALPGKMSRSVLVKYIASCTKSV